VIPVERTIQNLEPKKKEDEKEREAGGDGRFRPLGALASNRSILSLSG
jgi:hypothetical protein